MAKILYSKPSITELEIEYVRQAVSDGWGENCYEFVSKFESSFKNYLGVRHAVSTSSCTGALHMGMHALGIKPGDEVILADTNWVASVAPIVHLGAKPVFVDILRDSWCIDPELVESAITSRTKAILAVHMYGNLCNMNRLLDISKRYNIPLIEDAAEAIGSCYFSRYAGSMSSFGVFSFHGTKTLTTGEGGMFVTNNDELYEKVLTLSNHGRSRSQAKFFWPDRIGYKYKMSNIQAALGCAQLERVDELVSRKRQILDRYKSSFSLLGLDDCSFNLESPNTRIGAWMVNCVFNFLNPLSSPSSHILSSLNHSDIAARPFFVPLSSTPPFANYKSLHKEQSIAALLPKISINLPSYHDITDEEIYFVSEVVKGSISSLES